MPHLLNGILTEWPLTSAFYPNYLSGYLLAMLYSWRLPACFSKFSSNWRFFLFSSAYWEGESARSCSIRALSKMTCWQFAFCSAFPRLPTLEPFSYSLRWKFSVLSSLLDKRYLQYCSYWTGRFSFLFVNWGLAQITFPSLQPFLIQHMVFFSCHLRYWKMFLARSPD